MKNLSLILLAAAMVACCPKPKTTVACIGDSITEGFGIKNQNVNGYPEQLRAMLGPDYCVQNCGRSATTMMTDGDFPYWTCNEFSNALALNADIVVIKLGTNDTKRYQWNAESYARSYRQMIDTLRSGGRNPRILLCTPVPVRGEKWTINDSTVVAGVIPIVRSLADEYGFEVIDLYQVLDGRRELLSDSVHPNAEGASLMARAVADAITHKQ